MSTRKPRLIVLSTEIIKELDKLKPVRLSTPRDCGYGDAIDEAIRLIRSIRVKRGLRVKRIFTSSL